MASIPTALTAPELNTGLARPDVARLLLVWFALDLNRPDPAVPLP